MSATLPLEAGSWVHRSCRHPSRDDSAGLWRFFSRPHIVLSLLLVVLMLYLVLTPLLIMVQTTSTWQQEDQRLASDVVAGRSHRLPLEPGLQQPDQRGHAVAALLEHAAHLAGHLRLRPDHRHAAGLAGGAHRPPGPRRDPRAGHHPLHAALVDHRAGLDRHLQERAGGRRHGLSSGHHRRRSRPTGSPTGRSPSSSRSRSTTTPSPSSWSPAPCSRWMPGWRRAARFWAPAAGTCSAPSPSR